MLRIYHLWKFGLKVLIWELPVYRQYFKICEKKITYQVSADLDGIKGLPLKYASIQNQGDKEKLVIRMKREQLGKEEENWEAICAGGQVKDWFDKDQMINVPNPVDRSSRMKTEQ